MIQISDITYNEDVDMTSFKSTFSSGDYKITFDLSEEGNLSESDIKEILQQEYENWIERIS